MAVKMPSQESIKSILDYDPETGEFIWKKHRYAKLVGAKACKVNKEGYLRIFIDGKSYLSHRLAWLYVYGKWPSDLDHINHNKSDNSIANLREATATENNRNCRLRRRNRSGFNGVGYVKRTGMWQARIGVDGGAAKTIGTFRTKAEAVQARKEANHIYGYHPNHGKLLPHEVKEPQ